MELQIDPQLIDRLNVPGPRYTSYPTAPRFRDDFRVPDFVEVAEASHGPLSLYLHIPFCHSPCWYCGCHKMITRNSDRVRSYVDDLLRELELKARWFGGRPVHQLHFGGGTPTYLSREQLTAIVEAIDELYDLLDDGSGEYSIEIDPRSCDAEMVRTLLDLGFNRLSMGVQDFDPDVQAAVNRVQPRSMVEGLMSAARDGGARSVSLDLIFGLPRQTADRFDNTLDAVIDLAPDRVSLFSYAHLPTRFRAQRLIVAEDLPSAEEKIAILTRSVARLTGAGYVPIGMDHFAREDDELVTALREGTLNRNFQGYSTRGGLDLIGFGVSAISQIGRTYSQNVTELSAYRAAMGASQPPLSRGIWLTDDDLKRRAVIMALMCRDEITFAELSAKCGVDFASHFSPEIEAVRALESDGLVEVRSDRFVVPPLGRLFRRRLAMAFDRYLEGERSTGYSRVV